MMPSGTCFLLNETLMNENDGQNSSDDTTWYAELKDFS